MLNKRQTYAKGIDKLLDRTQRRPQTLPVFRPLQRPEAVSAASDDLRRIAKTLRSDQSVDNQALRDVKTLLTDGASSPLFRSDADAARRATARIRESVEA